MSVNQLPKFYFTQLNGDVWFQGYASDITLLWKSYKLKIMTPDHGRFSQGSRSFKTTDDSVKYS